MTPERRERANRFAVAYALGMVMSAGVFVYQAWEWFSWTAVGFAFCSLFALLAIGSSVLLFWVATSVDAVDPQGGRVTGTPTREKENVNDRKVVAGDAS